LGTGQEIRFTYDDLDELWRKSVGEHADITAAYYAGDYGKSLAQAQCDKHTFILEGIGFRAGQRVLDIGCGWGPMLHALRERGGRGVGISLSPAQVACCRRAGLDARLLDWRDLPRAAEPPFDGIVSVGAFEHFCSVEDYLAGRRDSIYRDFFATCHQALAPGGMLFLQTMTWGARLPWGEREPTARDIEACSARAPWKSDERVLASVRAFFPGAWLPRGKEHVLALAAPHFELTRASDGRLDYVQTLTDWEKAWLAPGPGKGWARWKGRARRVFGGAALRAKMRCLEQNDIREVFLRNLFGHQRLFFKRR
jgi:cyclopropane-fatty-acyl-phospholipid synthase